MFGQSAVDRFGPARLRGVVVGAIGIALLATLVIALVDAPHDRLTNLSAVLAIAAFAAGIMVAGTRGAPSVSASFIVCVLAAAFLGPASAAAAAILSELAAAAR